MIVLISVVLSLESRCFMGKNILGFLILFYLYYGFKVFWFHFFKNIVKVKFLKDKKFKIFGKEL